MFDRSTQSSQSQDRRKRRDQTHAERSVALLEGRTPPRFFVVDEGGRLVALPHHLHADEHVARSVSIVAELIERDGITRETVFEPFDRERLLRIVPLAVGERKWYAVFVEAVNCRNAFASAMVTFAFSPREGNVLELLLGGYSTAQIAIRLFIAEGTVGDHVQSMFRKTGTGKRSDLVSRVYGHEDDGILAWDSEPSEG
jgi:DNA-binding CsgD family transcriptional regulator